MKIFIIGSGPSGLICSNILQNLSESCEDLEYEILTTDVDGFKKVSTKENLDYQIGQRTFFHDDSLKSFLEDIVGVKPVMETLSDKIGVYFRKNIHKYPFQNNLGELKLREKISLYLSYYFRNKSLSDASNFADWVVGNYGEWLGKNIILPHTWKTIKEDLWMISSESYGQKVIPLGKKDKVSYHYSNASEIYNCLKDNVKDHVTLAKVTNIDIKNSRVHFMKGDEACNVRYDYLLNTIALPKLMRCIHEKEDILDVASKSLRWNNMFISVMIVPSKFIMYPHKIIYFPERDYIFSKVNINRYNGYTSIVSEVSFRRNDEDLLRSDAYKNKIMEKIEYDLKKSGLLEENLFTTFNNYTHFVSPAYIICDGEYSMYNNILQTYLEHQQIYNVGRFSQWLPHMRVEHSYQRSMELMKKLGLIK